MGNDTLYVYGDNNGAEYADTGSDHRKTHWDPRLEMKVVAGTVQVGIIPASDKSTDDGGIWDNDDGQFLTLSRSALNRLIVMARECRDDAYGPDQ